MPPIGSHSQSRRACLPRRYMLLRNSLSEIRRGLCTTNHFLSGTCNNFLYRCHSDRQSASEPGVVINLLKYSRFACSVRVALIHGIRLGAARLRSRLTLRCTPSRTSSPMRAAAMMPDSNSTTSFNTPASMNLSMCNLASPPFRNNLGQAGITCSRLATAPWCPPRLIETTRDSGDAL